MVCQLPPSYPELIDDSWEPWSHDLPQNLPGRYIPYETFIIASPTSPDYVQDTLFPANPCRNVKPFITLCLTHIPTGRNLPRTIHCLVYGWCWMLFDTVRGRLETQWRLGLNIPSALNYDPTRNRWGVPWTDKMRRNMFGKGWWYRGMRGNILNTIQGAVRKVVDLTKKKPKMGVWKTADGEYMANLDVSRFFSVNWQEYRNRTGRPWKSVFMPCPCGHCQRLRRHQALNNPSEPQLTEPVTAE
ncbi:hypothetical protein EYR41_007264 [Orbilia oligospora]|uniref:Uncharacterized protein n=1 Tax=Orbilia oligospora TaxID=2813651 RepID=A0A8H2E2E0_ORBOL|nr:hypothetical protein EYR41_007264 [Orbilia oligospora]